MNTLIKTKKIMNKFNIVANKRYGQNFLIDDNILENIVNASDITSDDLVIEIGPGLGNLTEYLLEAAKHVLLIEIDPKMITVLEDRFKDVKNYTLLNEDILKVNVDELVKEIEEKINNNEISVDNLDEYIGKLENSIYSLVENNDVKTSDDVNIIILLIALTSIVGTIRSMQKLLFK